MLLLYVITLIVNGGMPLVLSKLKNGPYTKLRIASFAPWCKLQSEGPGNSSVVFLEKDFSKATAAIKRIKRNKESSATYSHPDGPAASVTAMGSHLASVYDGSLLATATRPAAPPTFDSVLPFCVPVDLSLFDVDYSCISHSAAPNT
ncbi:DNA-binding transcription factor [Mucor velutinosus]|uniref:DNA-binding transcription factor n=1 Tax=Mucor velutinosus TaxID=708070 RepID=A0AAN7D8L3_9FUNG|nr:DNA-binding transcription factor [Mucor velutinosus]